VPVRGDGCAVPPLSFPLLPTSPGTQRDGLIMVLQYTIRTVFPGTAAVGGALTSLGCFRG
jgi:hypothetical protein